MTCIVGIEHGRGVTIGVDSLASTDDVTVLRDDPKLFRVGPYLIGSSGSVRTTQLLQHAFKPPRPDIRDLHRFMVTDFVDALRECLSIGDALRYESQVAAMPGAFLVGVAGSVYAVEGDLQVGRLAYGYNTVGSGEPFALGSLHTTATMDIGPVRRVRLALAAAAEHNPFVRAPFTIKTMKP
jgi:ATP-dependent protease HslVU (ClpYQ) peptidase subunit